MQAGKILSRRHRPKLAQLLLFTFGLHKLLYIKISTYLTAKYLYVSAGVEDSSETEPKKTKLQAIKSKSKGWKMLKPLYKGG